MTLRQEELTLEEKIKLLSGKSGEEIAEKYGKRFMRMSDGPHGVRPHGVCYPNMCLAASSWDKQMLYEMGRSIGEDCIAEGIDVLLGPSVNLKRTPLCGRNFEYISEDPYLAGTLGAEYVRGLQSRGVSACVKHFCCYNQENNRFTQKIYVDEETLMDFYVRVFRIIIGKSSPDYLMTSYNNVNGEFMSQNRDMIQRVLRGLLGFKGIVITDWGGVDFRMKAMEAGVDINMPGDADTSWREIADCIAGSPDAAGMMEKSVERVAAAIEKAAAPKKAPSPTDMSALRRMAAESMILLKNEDLLPLSCGDGIAVVGALAASPCSQGGGCAAVGGSRTLSPYEELCRRLGRKPEYAAGYGEGAAGAARAEQISAKADKVLFFAGLLPSDESEGYDRTTISLPEEQLELLKRIYAVNRNVVVVLTNGSAVGLSEVACNAGAILECYYAGDVYAEACCDVLFGDVNPSGRLAETFPVRLSDCAGAAYCVDKNDTVVYKEGGLIGYRHFLACGIAPQYPFGYGLSYTQFEYGDMRVSEMPEPGAVCVTVPVRNTGGRAGKEVVQVYLQYDGEPPALAGFDKIALEPGGCADAQIVIDAECFQRYDVHKKRYEKRAGEYTISVRKNSEETVCERSYSVAGKFVCTRYTKIDELRRVESGPELIKKYFSGCIGMAVLGDPDYCLSFKGNEIDDEPFVRNVSYSMPLFMFTTLTAGMLSNAQLDEIIEKINERIIYG